MYYALKWMHWCALLLSVYMDIMLILEELHNEDQVRNYMTVAGSIKISSPGKIFVWVSVQYKNVFIPT